MSEQARELTQASIPVINRQMPLVGKIISMIVVFGIAVPIDWVCKRLGLSPVMVGMMRRFRARRSWDEVFAGYVPTGHDVFVSTFAKSGTNWMKPMSKMGGPHNSQPKNCRLRLSHSKPDKRSIRATWCRWKSEGKVNFR